MIQGLKKLNIKKAIFLGVIFLGATFLLMALIVVYPNFFIKQLKGGNPEFVNFVKQGLKIKVDVAATPYEWTKGLMFREAMAQDLGMLFIFPNSEVRSFWMKNTLIPLDIIFISKDKKIVDIKENFQPCPSSQIFCPSYNSVAESMYVVEVNAEVVSKNNIKVGDKVEF